MRARGWIALLCLVALGAGATWAVRERRVLMQRAIETEALRRGWVEPRLTVTGVGLSSAALREVSLGAGAQLSAQHIGLDWSPDSLRARRLLRVDVAGLRLRAGYDDGFSLGVRERVAASGGGAPPLLPFDAASLADAEVVVVTPHAELRAAGEGEYDEGVVRLHAALDPFDVAREAGGSLRVPGLVMEAEADVAELGATPVEFTLAVRDAGRRAALQVDGTADLAGPSVEAALRLEPVVFAAGGLQPGQLAPELGELLRDVTGTVTGEGSVRWEAGQLTSRFDLSLTGVAATLPFGRVTGLATQLHLVGPWPPVLSGTHRVAMESVDVGVVLEDGDVRYRLLPNRGLDVERATFRYAGGTLSTSGKLDPSADPLRLVVRARGIDLEQLLASVALEGLSGEGILDGDIPVVRRGGRVEIDTGRIEAREGEGVIRYRAPANVMALAAGQQGVGVLLEALRDFHYEELAATLDGDALSDVRLVFRLKGRNPEALDGRPVHFTLNLDAPFLALLRGTAASLLVPELLEKSLREQAGGGR